jgi:hypothetical protein
VKKTRYEENKIEMNYEKLVDDFKLYECTLLSTMEEIEVLLRENPKKNLYFQKVRFVSKCGHEAQGYFVNVKSKGTGVLCKECSKMACSKKLKDFVKDSRIRCLEIENEGYNFIKNAVKDIFEVVKTNEGCLADFIIRPIGVQSDDWLKIQLKTTLNQSLGLYGFAMSGKSYPNCLIVCVCLGDKRTWILDGDTIPCLKGKLNIGAGNSKYSKYEVNETKMRDVFTEMYTTKPLFTQSECLIPISAQHKQEQIYRQIRETQVPFAYTYSEMEGLEYDFKIGETKFQEKVCSIAKPNWFIAGLYTNDGSNRKSGRKFKAYKKGENDFYWLWLKDTKIFYVIPEEKLIEYNKIETDTKMPYLGISMLDKNKWYQQYKFDADNLDIDKLKDLLNI